MASVRNMTSVRNTLCILATLLLMYQKTATGDFLSPLLSPLFDDVCKEVECGKGKCKPSSNSTFMFDCECDAGWKQIDLHLKFLPCIIPNCTFNLACGKAPSPIQSRTPKDNNGSFIDPCHWTDCGGGFCNKTSPFTYACECQEGYSNLLNVSAFPCFKQCALGMDCENLGIPLSNTSASPNPALADSGKNQAGLNKRRTCFWWIIAALYISAAPWI